jgi:hypothetical protein
MPSGYQVFFLLVLGGKKRLVIVKHFSYQFLVARNA